eukprot:6365749-Prymnesium_polylepis.1
MCIRDRAAAEGYGRAGALKGDQGGVADRDAEDGEEEEGLEEHRLGGVVGAEAVSKVEEEVEGEPAEGGRDRREGRRPEDGGEGRLE